MLPGASGKLEHSSRNLGSESLLKVRDRGINPGGFVENQTPYMEAEWEPRNQGSGGIKPGWNC